MDTKALKLFWGIIILLFFGFMASQLTGCSTNQKTVESKPQEYSFKWNNTQWDSYLVEALKKKRTHNLSWKPTGPTYTLLDLYPKDLRDYTDKPFITENDRIEFWGKLLVEIAKWESNYKPATKYTETILDNNGKRVVSRGLFQLSYESGRGYGCYIPTETDLHDPRVNIDCAVQIIGYLVKAGNCIRCKSTSGSWRGAAAYFNVLRGTIDYTRRSLQAIKGANR